MFLSAFRFLSITATLLGLASVIPMSHRREAKRTTTTEHRPADFRPGFPQRSTPPQMISGNPNLQSFAGGGGMQGGGMMGMGGGMGGGR